MHRTCSPIDYASAEPSRSYLSAVRTISNLLPDWRVDVFDPLPSAFPNGKGSTVFQFHTCPVCVVEDTDADQAEDALVVANIFSRLPWHVTNTLPLLVYEMPSCWTSSLRSYVDSNSSLRLHRVIGPFLRFDFDLRTFRSSFPSYSPPSDPFTVRDCPQSFILDSLRLSDSPVIAPYHEVHLGVELYADSIVRSPTACIRLEDTQEPVAWIIRYSLNGAIGFLYVLEEYRRLGLAKRVVNSIMLQCLELEEQRDPTDVDYGHDERWMLRCHIAKDNMASRGLMEGVMKFQVSDIEYVWCVVVSDDEGSSADEET